MNVSQSENSIRIEGSIERVTFHSEETGYSVLRVKVRGHRELVTFVGSVSAAVPGETIEGFGNWIQDKNYGLQFKAQALRTVPPSSLEGIEKYLGSGMVKGIGPHFAAKLVREFGFDVFHVIEGDPSRLRKVRGIGSKRIDLISSAWKDQKVVRSIMVFLQSHGVSSSKAVRIFKTYGDLAVEKVKSNPYQLAQDIRGIGFKSADIIAGKLGIQKDSILRARAGILYILMEQSHEGHCAFPEDDLLVKSSELLEIHADILSQAIEDEIAKNTLKREVIQGRICLYSSVLLNFEKEVASRILLMNQLKTPWRPFQFETAIPWVEKELSMSLASLQKDAVVKALSSKMTIITGGPGTGKSTLTRAIWKLLNARGMRIGLCSPTGRAAKRLSECTQAEAKTIHRLLSFDPKKGGFLHNQGNLLPFDVILIDEASMVDIQLMHSLITAIPLSSALIIVGDSDQLPSVGPGQVLKDLIASKVIPTVCLTEIFRQAAQSQIIQAAHRINQGQFPNLEPELNSDFYFIPCEDVDNIVSKITELVQNRIPNKFKLKPVQEIQVLCPMQRGLAGARNLNAELQKVLNPSPVEQVERFGYRFGVADRVMVLQNDYDKDVFNGDMGDILRIDQEDQEVWIDFEGREVSFGFGELDILQPAYTVTIHKSQGSEYPAVVIPIMTQHFMMLRKNLIYTGVTRGKKLVVLVGQKKALAIALKQKVQSHRWTNLQTRLSSLH